MFDRTTPTMSGSIEIYSTVASLPLPFDAENGRTYAAPVTSFSGSRKRKRHEVVAGVDGESVNIYNVCIVGVKETGIEHLLMMCPSDSSAEHRQLLCAPSADLPRRTAMLHLLQTIKTSTAAAPHLSGGPRWRSSSQGAASHIH